MKIVSRHPIVTRFLLYVPPILILVILILPPFFTEPICEVPPHGKCMTRLSAMYSQLQYYNEHHTHVSHEDIERSEYDNWGELVLTKNDTIRKLLICPLDDEPENSNVNDYWWADLSNKGCYPKNQLGPSVKRKIPIAGDAPDNHEDLPPIVLLNNGSVKEAKKGSKLWKRAYGGGEGNCLKPPGGD